MGISTSDQLTAIYSQLQQINQILSGLASLSSVNTIQGNIQAQMNAVYASVNTLQQSVQALDITVSDILIDLRGG